jgi:hypothetical protein
VVIRSSTPFVSDVGVGRGGTTTGRKSVAFNAVMGAEGRAVAAVAKTYAEMTQKSASAPAHRRVRP